MNVADALAKVGFDVAKDENSEAYKLAECKKKFGSADNFKFPVKNPKESFLVGLYCKADVVYSSEGAELLSDMVQRGLMNSKSIKVESLSELFRVSEEDKVLSALDSTIKDLEEDKVDKEILHITDDVLKSQLAWYIRYVKAEGKFYLHTSDAVLADLLRQEGIQASTGLSNEIVKGNLHVILAFLAKKSAFIPVILNTSNFSVRVFKANGKFYKHGVDSYLGQTVLDSEELQEEYAEWFNQGYVVNPKVWYLGLKSKDGFNYLKRDLTRSPKETGNN